MYARVGITTEERPDALVVPTNALVDVGGERGVFLAQADNTAVFRPVEVGIEAEEVIEIRGGLSEGDRVVTTGAAALRDGDRFVLEGEAGGAIVGGSPQQRGRSAQGGREGFPGREGGGRRGGQ